MTNSETNLDTIAKLAVQSTLRSGSHVPMLLAEGDKRSVMVPMLNMGETAEDRFREMYWLGMVLATEAEIGVLQQVFFISEAWLSVPEDPDKKPYPRPSEDLKRKEVLTVTGLQVPGDRMKMKVYEMQRGQDESLVTLNDLELAATETQSPLLMAFAQGFLGVTRRNHDTH